MGCTVAMEVMVENPFSLRCHLAGPPHSHALLAPARSLAPQLSSLSNRTVRQLTFSPSQRHAGRTYACAQICTLATKLCNIQLSSLSKRAVRPLTLPALWNMEGNAHNKTCVHGLHDACHQGARRRHWGHSRQSHALLAPALSLAPQLSSLSNRTVGHLTFLVQKQTGNTQARM